MKRLLTIFLAAPIILAQAPSDKKEPLEPSKSTATCTLSHVIGEDDKPMYMDFADGKRHRLMFVDCPSDPKVEVKK